VAKFKQLYRIIEDVVNGISWTIEIISTSESNGIYTLEVCDTAYLNECEIITVDGDKWEVVGFTFNKELKLKAYGHSNPFTATQIVLGNPTYYHGTVRLTNAEYTSEDRKQDILPVVYLYETLNEQVSLRNRDNIERTANIRLFILMSNKFEDFIQVDYDTQLYDPLSNIEEKITEGLKNSTKISNFTERYTRTNHDQFGYTDRNGELQRIFADELSALELEIPLNINKCGCNNECEC
jgi:hypothetical protein